MEKSTQIFHNNKIPKEGSQFVCLSVILIDSVLEQVKIIILKCFLEECKCIIKEKKMPEYIIDNVEISSDLDRENSDEEHSDEEHLDEEN